MCLFIAVLVKSAKVRLFEDDHLFCTYKYEKFHHYNGKQEILFVFLKNQSKIPQWLLTRPSCG